jgi:hypothetical protein
MQRLPDRHEVDGGLRQIGFLRGRDAVRDPPVRRRFGDLLGARVRRDDLGEVLREAAGRLPAARARVPAQRVAGNERCKRVE